MHTGQTQLATLAILAASTERVPYDAGEIKRLFPAPFSPVREWEEIQAVLHEEPAMKFRYGRCGKTCDVYLLPTVVIHPLAYSWATRCL